MTKFKVKAPFQPAGSQPEAIKKLVAQRPGRSTLMGVTGSGKTFTTAHVIEEIQKPTLILSPNKTLAAQLYEEFSLFFPDNKVCYFVSYYDYYQPESYLPAQDIYVPKETKVNSEIERLRVESTASLVNRNDTIVVTSVSCIYGLGNPYDYKNLALKLNVGDQIARADLLRQLIFIQYTRNDVDRSSGTFSVVGNIVEVTLPYQKERLRIELFGSTIERMCWLDRNNNNVLAELDNTLIFPAKHFVTTEEKKERAIESILTELDDWLPQLKNPIYQDRLARRVQHDVEMIKEVGYCNGIENYSAHFDGRTPGQPPYCLFDFFEPGFLMVIDESHIAIPQLRGMYAGDRSRKQSLIDFGFRLPSAFDNRPLKFEEIEKYFGNALFVSATPSEYELSTSQPVVEQIIRPTGLVDPQVEVRPRTGQIDDLLAEINKTIDKGYRTLITVLTKKMAEELAEFFEKKKIKVCYLHSEIKTPERTAILQKLRMGIFDVLVGVNLLREGLDLPEVALVAIMDADVESFLRDKRSLIQTIGRAARNNEARVLMYADRITGSMHEAIEETKRRRELQMAFNKEHGLTPRSVQRDVTKSITPLAALREQVAKKKKSKIKQPLIELDRSALVARIVELEQQMQTAADAFKFEDAIKYREEWLELKQQLGEDVNLD